jgi:hypothetical protein
MLVDSKNKIFQAFKDLIVLEKSKKHDDVNYESDSKIKCRIDEIAECRVKCRIDEIAECRVNMIVKKNVNKRQLILIRLRVRIVLDLTR